MQGYAVMVAGNWVALVQSPIGVWVELKGYERDKALIEERLRSLGYKVIQR